MPANARGADEYEEEDDENGQDDDARHEKQLVSQLDTQPSALIRFDAHRLRYWKQLSRVDTSSPEFLALPPEVQHEILTEVKEYRRRTAWARFDRLQAKATTGGSFSDFQVQNLLRKNTISQRLDTLEKAMMTSSSFDSGIELRRVAGEADTEILLRTRSVDSVQSGPAGTVALNNKQEDNNEHITQEDSILAVVNELIAKRARSSKAQQARVQAPSTLARVPTTPAPPLSFSTDFRSTLTKEPPALDAEISAGAMFDDEFEPLEEDGSGDDFGGLYSDSDSDSDLDDLDRAVSAAMHDDDDNDIAVLQIEQAHAGLPARRGDAQEDAELEYAKALSLEEAATANKAAARAALAAGLTFSHDDIRGACEGDDDLFSADMFVPVTDDQPSSSVAGEAHMEQFDESDEQTMLPQFVPLAKPFRSVAFSQSSESAKPPPPSSATHMVVSDDSESEEDESSSVSAPATVAASSASSLSAAAPTAAAAAAASSPLLFTTVTPTRQASTSSVNVNAEPAEGQIPVSRSANSATAGSADTLVASDATTPAAAPIATTDATETLTPPPLAQGKPAPTQSSQPVGLPILASAFAPKPASSAPLASNPLSAESTVAPPADPRLFFGPGQRSSGLQSSGTAALSAASAALDAEAAALRQELNRYERDVASVDSEMIADTQELLRLFGMPYLTAPMEAEAQCAALDLAGITDGTITEDSDVFLFGARRVYRNFFNPNKYAEFYASSAIESYLALDREKLIDLALLLGSDYTSGVERIGPVLAMEILGDFPSLQEFATFLHQYKFATSDLDLDAVSPLRRKLGKMCRKSPISPPDNFPDVRVRDAYRMPTVEVNPNDKFTWRVPELSVLREFTSRKLGWSQAQCDEFLVPAIRRLHQRQTVQLSIHDYFPLQASGTRRNIKSKRLQNVVLGMLGMPAAAAPAPTKSRKAAKDTATDSDRTGRKQPAPRSKRKAAEAAASAFVEANSDDSETVPNRETADADPDSDVLDESTSAQASRRSKRRR
ncbi:hypothetical protein CAOG_009506 [Capsaspora owczarzaki ATCC 30864]|uniref:XPG-I domain-containing protein n=1 Tax=Capsaspora owczarzaki (strain ATCC 30864) TaxID=595528 RepID=A0A0D2X1J6_CAPO3|nr:hypothetical protein CAOG_009506 [Capsaspora owczarzaki ATCC 30864]